MKSNEHPNPTPSENVTPQGIDENNWENDPIWELLRQSPAPRASAGFTDRVMASIHKHENVAPAFWTKIKKTCAASLAAASCIIGGIVFIPAPISHIAATPPAAHEPQAAETFADLQETANHEVLLAAADYLNDFSDTELVSLIGL